MIEKRTREVERSKESRAREERTLGGGRCVRGGTSDWPLMSENRKWSVSKVSDCLNELYVLGG